MDLPAPAGLVTARKTVEYFLIGAPSSDLPSGDIPSKKDLLKVIIWERDRLEKEKTSKFLDAKKIVSISCLSKLKERYQEASIPIQSDQKIVQKLVDLYKYYKDPILKRKDRMGTIAKKTRDEFVASLDEELDVKTKTENECSFSQALNVVQHRQFIGAGDKTSPLQVTVTSQMILGQPRFVTLSISDPSDVSINFSRKFRKGEFQSLKDQEGLLIGFDKFPELLVELLKKCLTEPNFFLKQKISTSGSVLEFVESNKIKNLVHLSLSLFAMNESDKVSESLGSGLDINIPSGSGLNDGDGQTTEDDSSDEDEYHIASPRKKPRRTRKIWLEVPVDILRMTKQAAAELNLSPTAHAKIISAVILACGGDLDDFPVSPSTSKRDKTKAGAIVAKRIQDEFKQIMKNKSIKVICHFDGKKLPVIDSDQLKAPVKERIAVLVKSPDIPFGEQLFGVPQLVDGRGVTHSEAVIDLLDDWDARDHVIGCCVDTCSVMLGCNSGAVTVIERELGHPILKLQCTHHVTDLHGDAFCDVISGRESSAPYDYLFKKIFNHWDYLEIDLDNLCKFDWSQFDEGSWIFQKARESLSLMETLLDGGSMMFSRGDYYNLCLLTMVYLGGDTTKFQFPKPIRTSSARFMQLPTYYLAGELLSNQIDKKKSGITDDEFDEIESMALFSALFFTRWFLTCNIAANSPIHDLNMINDMRLFMETLPNDHYNSQRIQSACDKCLKSMYRHSQYLSGELVPLALISDKVPKQEKMDMAEALARAMAEQDDSIFQVPRKTVQFNVLDIWPNPAEKPSLAKFITKKSLLIFFLLDILNPDNMNWLQEDPDLWLTYPGYATFEKFVKNLEVVNDASERSVKLAQDFLKTSKDESKLQNNYLVVADVRNRLRDKRGTKASFKRIPVGY